MRSHYAHWTLKLLEQKPPNLPRPIFEQNTPRLSLAVSTLNTNKQTAKKVGKNEQTEAMKILLSVEMRENYRTKFYSGHSHVFMRTMINTVYSFNKNMIPLSRRAE